MAGVPGRGQFPRRERLLGARQQGLERLLRDSVDIFVGRADLNCSRDQMLVAPRGALDNRDFKRAESSFELVLRDGLRFLHRHGL